MELRLIQTGKPTQNAFIESFNGKFRDECLNEHWFLTMDHARVVIAAWRRDYNEYRPHSSLGKFTPSEFATLCREVKRIPEKAMDGIKTFGLSYKPNGPITGGRSITKGGNEMSQGAIKLTEKAGTSISKEKLLEAIRKSPNKQFTYSQSTKGKSVVIVELT